MLINIEEPTLQALPIESNKQEKIIRKFVK